MKAFWIDEARHINISYTELLAELANMDYVPKYIHTDNPYEMIRNMIFGMVSGDEIYLLDNDFSSTELAALGIETQALNERIKIHAEDMPKDIAEMIKLIIKRPWKLWLFTSGTTGLPKKVAHTYQSLGRNVRRSEKHGEDIWAMAYRMSHMAGVQVLLQAIMNGNTMIYVFESLPSEVISSMQVNKCSHISATPTFYRNILPFIENNSLPNLRHITMGGEKYDGQLFNKLAELLPTVKLHNIYASTEAGSILNAEGDGFTIPKAYNGLVKISDENELLLHESLLGSFSTNGEWYNTHDLVEERDGKIYFISRQSDLLNIGGYKVNPLEVEDALLSVMGVADCVVKGQPNSVLGTMLKAEIVPQDGYVATEIKKNIRRELQGKLQPFKIPRLIEFVQTVEKTRTGKKVRK